MQFWSTTFFILDSLNSMTSFHPQMSCAIKLSFQELCLYTHFAYRPSLAQRQHL